MSKEPPEKIFPPSFPDEELERTETNSALYIEPGQFAISEKVPEQIGHYRLLKRIGAGGMGEVYKAEQLEPMRRKVALKLIRLGMDTELVLSRFEMERQSLAMMNHVNIAQIYDGGMSEQGRPYFVMEYVDGIPIDRYCNEQNLDTRHRLKMFQQVCEGMQHAHQKGIIHRDIKPSNVLVEIREGKAIPKIIDFGVAKATHQAEEDATAMTQMGQIIGTPIYMSPEQVMGQDIDTRTDVYALGVMLYELLVGIHPLDYKRHPKRNTDEILHEICEEDPSRPSTQVNTLGDDGMKVAAQRGTDQVTLARELRGDLDWITMKSLEKERERRYNSPLELSADIERYLKNEPVLACPPSTSYRVQKFVRRHRVGVAAALVVLVALLVGITGTTIGMIRAVRAEKVATEEAETAQQVSDFLVELFEVSDPDEARGNTITAREILDTGAKKVERELAGQPAVQARLMLTIGTVYRTLGLYSKAQIMQEKALGMRRSIYGSNNLDVADTLRQLGVVYDSQGQYEKAASVFKESLEIRKKLLAPNDPAIAQSLNSLAICYFNQEQYEKAEPLFEESLAIKEKMDPQDDLELANTLVNLGVLKTYQKKFEEAERYLRKALVISEKKLADDNPSLMATIFNNLSALFERQDRNSEAEPLSVKSLAIWEKILGPDHPDVAIALHNLAGLYRKMGKYAKAEPLYLRSLTIWEKSLSPDHPYIGISLRERANLYRDTGRYADAEQLYIRSFQIFEKNPNENDLQAAETIEDHILLLRKMNRNEDASTLEKRLDDIRDHKKASKS